MVSSGVAGGRVTRVRFDVQIGPVQHHRQWRELVPQRGSTLAMKTGVESRLKTRGHRVIQNKYGKE